VETGKRGEMKMGLGRGEREGRKKGERGSVN